MKKIIHIPFIFFVLNGLSQSGELKTGVYSWTAIAILEKCNISGEPFNPSIKIASRIGQKFNYIQNKDANTAVIQILNYNDDSPEFLLFNNTVSKSNAQSQGTTGLDLQRAINDGQLYFLVPFSTIEKSAKPVFDLNWQFTIGTLTMPIKMRVQNEFDFTGSFNISAAGGVKKRISRYHENYINGLVSIGLSSVNIDSSTRRNSVVKILPAANLSALTIGAGIVFEFGTAQAGIVYGWDFLSSRDQNNYQWKYNGKPWLAIGFGLAIFGKQQEQASAKDIDNKKPS